MITFQCFKVCGYLLHFWAQYKTDARTYFLLFLKVWVSSAKSWKSHQIKASFWGQPRFSFRQSSTAQKKVDTKLLTFFSGHTLLHSPVVVEKLGSRQNPSANDGFRPWHHIRGRKAIEKETVVGLPLRKLEKPQLLGLQILFLWATGIVQCHWYVT